MAERIYDITEIARRTRESLKKEFPNLTFSVTKESFSGGSSMSVSLMKGDFNPFTTPEGENYLQLNNYYIDRDDRLTEEAKKVMIRAREIAQTYNWDNSDPMTDYFDVNYYLHMAIGKWDKPYEMVAGKASAKKSFPEKSAPSGERKSYPMGEVLKDCSGWTIYKKTLPDGRIVYNAKIKPETPKNKGDWNTIKGEIYTETKFKWGKFGAFERWGEISDQNSVVEKLCEILGKYYEGGDKPVPAPQSTTLKEGEKFKMYGKVYEINRILEGRVFYNPVDDEWAERDITISEAEKNYANGVWVKIEDEEAPEAPAPQAPTPDASLPEVGDRFFVKSETSGKVYEIVKMDMGTVFIKPDGESWEVPYPFGEVKDNFSEGRWVKVQDEEEETPAPPAPETPAPDSEDEATDLFIDGRLIKKFPSVEKTIEYLEEKFGGLDNLKKMQNKQQIFNDRVNKKFYVFENSFVYGKNLNVPEFFGNDLQFAFAEGFFKVYVASKGDKLVIYNTDMGSDGVIINDNGGEFNLFRYGYSDGSFATVSYFLDEIPISPTTLAFTIRDIYYNYFMKKEEPKAKSKEEIEKAIKGLQFLADKGNEKAKKAIIGLKILLNK